MALGDLLLEKGSACRKIRSSHALGVPMDTWRASSLGDNEWEIICPIWEWMYGVFFTFINVSFLNDMSIFEDRYVREQDQTKTCKGPFCANTRTDIHE